MRILMPSMPIIKGGNLKRSSVPIVKRQGIPLISASSKIRPTSPRIHLSMEDLQVQNYYLNLSCKSMHSCCHYHH